MFSVSDCPLPLYVGDGFCDDLNNINSCNFDGGDCCLETVITDFCTECICYEGFNGNTTNTITTISTTVVISGINKYKTRTIDQPSLSINSKH